MSTCCAHMTNLFIQKVMVTIRKHLTQKQYVSSSLRVFARNLLNLFTMFFSVHMRIFCFSLYMTNFLNCVQSRGQGHRKKVSQNASYFSRIQRYTFTHTFSSNVIVPGVYWAFITMPFKNNYILQQSISSVKVKVILGEKNVGPKMIFLDFFVTNVFIYCRGKNASLIHFYFYKNMYFTQFSY